MWNFNHIYIEKEIADHPRTQAILKKCSSRGIFYVDRYMDIFGRKRQGYPFPDEVPVLNPREGIWGAPL